MQGESNVKENYEFSNMDYSNRENRNFSSLLKVNIIPPCGTNTSRTNDKIKVDVS